jgi:hypothetical protein
MSQRIYPQNALRHAATALNLSQHGTERIGNAPRLGAILATQVWALLVPCGCGAETGEIVEKAQKSQTRKTKGPLAQIHSMALRGSAF